MPRSAEDGSPKLIANAGGFRVHDGAGSRGMANDTCAPPHSSNVRATPDNPARRLANDHFLRGATPVDQRTSLAIRALIAVCTGLVLLGYCRVRSMDLPNLHAQFGLPDVPPFYGTDQPLDSARLAQVLSDPARMKAGGPLGQGVDPQVWRDGARLSWLWSKVRDASGQTDAEWTRAARGEIAESMELLRNWPIPGVSGPAAEIAELEKIPESEIALLAAHRAELAGYFALMYEPEFDTTYSAMKPTDPEALGWLRQTDIETGLAGNRFDSAEEAAQFIETLYAAGAVKVVITTESIQAESPTEQYADAIRVVL